MTTTRTPFFGTYELLLRVFGACIRNRMKRLPHFPKERKGVSAKGPWGRHRGSEFRGARLVRATGPGSYTERDVLVRNFGAKQTAEYESLRATKHLTSMIENFLSVWRESGDVIAARRVAATTHTPTETPYLDAVMGR